MTTLVSPPSSKTPHPILHSQKDGSETDSRKIRIEKGEAGTETMDSTPRKTSEIKEEQEKVVYTNGFFSFIASPLRTGALPFQNHATSYRSNLDFARDKKRILEIRYQSDPVKTEKAIEPSPIEEGTTNSPVEKDTKVNDKKKDKEQKEKEKKDKEKKSKKKKKSSKKDEKETKKPKTEDQRDSASDVDTQEKKHQQMKDTTKTERLPLAETTKLSSKKTSNPHHTNEKEANPVEKATSTNPSEGDEKEKKKAIVKRDKAGKVVRKRKKSKGRGRVVGPDCFRKGKDAKIGLATINEGFYDGLDGNDSDDDSSRLTYDSWDCDEIWCTDHNLRSPPNSSDDDSELHSGDYGKSGNDDFVEVQKTEKISLRRAADQGKEVNKPNIFKRIMAKKLKKSSSSNYISSDSRQNNIASRYTASHALNLTNTTIMTTESDVPLTVTKTDSSQDSESLEEPIVSTCCTLTASARDDDSTDGRCKCWCFRSKWTMLITGVSFVIAVAAVTFAVGYFSIFEDTFEDDQDESSALVPIMEPRPNLRPSPKPSTDIIGIPTPTSILTTLSTSCYMPDDMPEIILVQAEDAPVINFAPIKSSGGGFCGDGYASLLPKVRAGFKFWSLEVESHGYYSVAIRYNNIDKGKTSLGLIINDLDKGTFDLLYTENESSWLVVMVNNVLLHEGENSIRISVLDSDQEKGPNVDWLAVVLQKPLSKFDYLSGLVAESSGITSQTLLQTRTLQWMANEDTVDYSDVTDVEIIERYALLQLYHYTAGDLWTTNDQWRSESHVCDWYGVNCSEEMIVTGLMLGTFFKPYSPQRKLTKF